MAYTNDMRKCDLFGLIDNYKPRDTIFSIDKTLKLHGHNILRLHLYIYICEFNPSELAWAKAKRLLRERNITRDFSMTTLKKEMTRNAFSNIMVEDWWIHTKVTIIHMVLLFMPYHGNSEIQTLHFTFTPLP